MSMVQDEFFLQVQMSMVQDEFILQVQMSMVQDEFILQVQMPMVQDKFFLQVQMSMGGKRLQQPLLLWEDGHSKTLMRCGGLVDGTKISTTRSGSNLIHSPHYAGASVVPSCYVPKLLPTGFELSPRGFIT